MGKRTRKNTNNESTEITRKQKRKQLRKQKKQKMKNHYMKPHGLSAPKHHPQNKSKITSKKDKSRSPSQALSSKLQNSTQKSQTQKIVASDLNPSKNTKKSDSRITDEDRQIQYYQKKLRLGGKNGKYKSMAKGLGYDNDLFDFLDNITKKIHEGGDYNEQEMQQMQEMGSEMGSEMEEEWGQGSGQDQEGDEGFDQQDENEEIQGEFQEQESNFQAQSNISDHFEQIPKVSVPQPRQVSKRPRLFASNNKDEQEKLNIRKRMVGYFNKLSDGNLMITFKQFSQVFGEFSRANSIEVFINTFIKVNVEVEKPHFHILLSNVALASALHHLIGSRLMAPLVHSIILRLSELQNQEQNLEEIQEIGYSKIFQRKKNIVTILSYLYNFGSLTGEFMLSFVAHLSKNLNSQNIEFLYLIIQKIGIKIRQNDPAVLKDIIQNLRSSIGNYKTSQEQGAQEKSKINIIEIELNELKFNRKMPQFLDQRLAFLTTFLTKNIPNEVNKQKQILLLTFDQIKTADISRTNWWDLIKKENKQFNENDNEDGQNAELIQQLTAERRQLLDLAKSLHLVTEIRKNIFIEIMQSEDYIEATRRILSLKIKNLQEISLVLVQVCTEQPTFNPFYPLIASKIANIMPKFKSKVQFTIWDQLKVLKSFDPRKTSNLAKFTARFIANPLANGSLSILKHYSDLINVSPYDSMFLTAFFSQFLKIVKHSHIVQMSKKLKSESNQNIKTSILEYLNEVGMRQKGFGHLQKMKLLRRMILLAEQEKAQDQN